MRRALLALLVALTAVSCQESSPRPPPAMTRLHVSEAKVLLHVISDDRGVQGGDAELLVVRDDGAVLVAEREGEALEFLDIAVPGAGRRPLLWDLYPLCVTHAAGYLVTAWLGRLPEEPQDLRYARPGALVRVADGAVTPAALEFNCSFSKHRLGSDLEERPWLQADGQGRLYQLAGSVFDGTRLRRADPAALEATAVQLFDTGAVRSFVVDAAGDVAADGRAGAYPFDDVVTFRSAEGPVFRPALGLLADRVWVAGDGAFHATRPREGGGTELVRLEVSAQGVTAVRTASWEGAPQALHGRPVALGDVRAFVEPTTVAWLSSVDAAPDVHALGFTWSECRAGDATLWFTSPDATGPSALLRWSPAGGAEEILAAGAFTIERVAPLGDDAVIVGAIDRATGDRGLYRVEADGTVAPLLAWDGALWDAVRLR